MLPRVPHIQKGPKIIKVMSFEESRDVPRGPYTFPIVSLKGYMGSTVSQ